jgi:Ca2+-binding RTX toxin-like protein
MRKFLASVSAVAVASAVIMLPAVAAPPCNGSTFDGSYDQAVVSNEYGFNSFGCQSLRLSNAVTSGAFGDQTFSPSVANEAGEAAATSNGFSGGTRQTRFEAQFDIAATSTSEQPGLFISVSPDRGDGSRMSYLGFGDSAGGIDVTFYDVVGTTSPVTFVPTVVAQDLSRTVPHTAKFVMDFVNGPSNDVVKIYIDGVLVHTGTSWENYYRYDAEASAEQTPRATDSLILRAGGSAAPGTSGQGFVFDNFALSSSTPVVPAAPLFWTEEDTTQVKVNWKAVSGADMYTVYHSPDAVSYMPVYTGTGLTFTHTVAVNTNNYYKVTAESGLGESASGTIAGKYAGTKDIVIDDGALASDFNTNGTATPSGGWTPYHVNDPNAYVQDVLSYTVGGDNYSVPGAFGAQTFDWTTSASLNGYYDVSVAYICDPSRGTASYNVYSGASQVNSGALTINQSLKSSDGLPCGPQTEAASQPFWKKIGNFAITGAGRVQLASGVGNNLVADAVAFHKTGNIVASSSSSSSVSTSSSSVGSCSAVSTTNLVGHWKLDENGGLTAIDSAGGNNDGTLENGPAYMSGTPAITPNPSALSFDGTDDQVRIANSGDFRFGTGAFTVSAFTKGTVGDRSVLGNFSNTQRGWGLYHYASERINFFGYGTMGTHDTSFAAPGLLNGQWHHVAGVYTRSGNSLTIKTYFDGALMGTHTVSVGDITSMSDLLLGKYLLQPNYAGSLDDVRVYARALNDGEVDALSDGCAGSSSSSVSSVPSSSSASSVSTSPSSSSVSSSSSSSSSAVAMCNGMTATIYVKNGKVVGGPQNGQNFVGTLNGTAGADVIVGTTGPDNIFGKGGADTICGGAGPDNLSGDGGADWINGEAGPDKIDGGDQGDFIVGGPDGDNLKGEDGADTLCGGDLGDLMDGGDGADKLDGAAGNDSLKGGAGSDACHRGEGHNSCESIVVTALPACVGF